MSRYYAIGSDVNCTMLESEQPYSFEYQGNAPKLVHTPLTDTCYLTLMHGMHLGCDGFDCSSTGVIASSIRLLLRG